MLYMYIYVIKTVHEAIIATNSVVEFGNDDTECCLKGHSIGRHRGAEIFKKVGI